MIVVMLNPTIQWVTIAGPLSNYLWLEFQRAVVWTAAFWLVTGITYGAIRSFFGWRWR